MLRTILSVIVGYVSIFILIFIAFAAAYTLMKADGAFKPGTFEVSHL